MGRQQEAGGRKSCHYYCTLQLTLSVSPQQTHFLHYVLRAETESIRHIGTHS